MSILREIAELCLAAEKLQEQMEAVFQKYYPGQKLTDVLGEIGKRVGSYEPTLRYLEYVQLSTKYNKYYKERQPYYDMYYVLTQQIHEKVNNEL